MPDQRKDVKQLLMDLVAIPSVSPMTNQPVIDYVTRQLDPRVWRLQAHSYTDPAGTLKTNLVAIAGNRVDFLERMIGRSELQSWRSMLR